MSRRRDALLHKCLGVGCIFALAATAAFAQYPGRIAKSDKPAPTLRAVSVLEWVGDPGKPSASRLVPVSVYDGAQLNDGAIYLNRPEPLALAGGTEYELQSGGKATRLFDVSSSGEFHDSWLGFGAVKALPSAEAKQAANAFNTSSLLNGGNLGSESAEDDKPVLKRKHPKGTDTDDAGPQKSAGGASADAGGSSSDSPALKRKDGNGSAGDSSQPTLKRKTDDSSASNSSSGSDSDRSTLKRKSGDDSGSQASTGSQGSSGSPTASASSGKGDADPDRPTLRRARKSNEAGMLETSNLAPDPDRPRLKHGKPAELDNTESPRLSGMPPNLQQAVAVSDASNRAEHPWKYTWANPDDEQKMKEGLEAIARTALGMDGPVAAPAGKPVSKTAAKAPVHKKTSMLHPEPAEEPAALTDEHFRVFELTYGATATLVLTAASPKPVVDETGDDDKTKPQPDETPIIKRGKPVQTKSQSSAKSVGKAKSAAPVKPAPQKFVTLIAQPDLYGGILVLYKSVTDSAHLDQTPRMRLIDAVDAMGDNRGELLFELRGAGQRQFALYRVLRGSAEQLFATVVQP